MFQFRVLIFTQFERCHSVLVSARFGQFQQCDHIWQNFVNLTMFESLFSIWQNFEPTLTKQSNMLGKFSQAYFLTYINIE